MTIETQNSLAERELVITRVLDAPRELVFKAWSEPERLAQWWGPDGFTNPVCELDFQQGGHIRIDMRGPNGTVYPMSGTVQEIVEAERFVFTVSPLDEKGNPLFENLNTITFTETNGKTTLHLHVQVVKIFDPIATQYLAGMEPGWNQTLDRLKAYVSKM